MFWNASVARAWRSDSWIGDALIKFLPLRWRPGCMLISDSCSATSACQTLVHAVWVPL